MHIPGSLRPGPCPPAAEGSGSRAQLALRLGSVSGRLAKSTLTLIPLLGIHEVVFAFVTDEHAQGTLRYVKLFFDLFLSSFQVSPTPGARAGRGSSLLASAVAEA